MHVTIIKVHNSHVTILKGKGSMFIKGDGVTGSTSSTPLVASQNLIFGGRSFEIF